MVCTLTTSLIAFKEMINVMMILNIMVLARICGNEDETRLALDDVQKRSCDEILCIQYKISLTEQVQNK
jgi:hypothetical protein